MTFNLYHGIKNNVLFFLIFNEYIKIYNENTIKIIKCIYICEQTRQWVLKIMIDLG